MTGRLGLAVLLLALPIPASAQRGGGPRLEVTPLAANSPPRGASVRAANVLGFNAKTRELLKNGFPALLRFRLELWRVAGMFDDIESTSQWEVLVSYDAYRQQYLVVRRQSAGGSLEDFGGFPTLDSAEAVLDNPFAVVLPPRARSRYYYNVVLDVETLSVSDLDELNRWFKGELRPAVRGKRSPLSALQRGLGTLLSRVLGGEKRHYEARSGTFRV